MAAISYEKKSLFLANPGTGSTTVQSVLINKYGWIAIGGKHDDYEMIMNDEKAALAGMFVFTAVRNPYDFFISEYNRFRGSWADKMQSNPDHWIHRSSSVKKRIKIALSGDFRKFVRYYLSHSKAPGGRWRDEYWGKAQFVMQTENLNNDFSNLLRILDMERPFDLPHLNRETSEDRKSSSELYTTELVEEVATKYSAFLKAFNYSYQEA